MTKQKFTKEALSQQKLLELLVSRGLAVPSAYEEARLRRALALVGYYRLTGYLLPFQVGGSGAAKHNLKKGTAVADILALYEFDTTLRRHCAGALEEIEVAFRTTLCDHMCRQHGAHWILNPDGFNPGTHKKHYEALAHAVEFDPEKNRPYVKQSGTHDFIAHYYSRYSSPLVPPSWMIRECASFGNWALLFKDLLAKHQKQICDEWKFPCGKRIDHSLLSGWVHSLSIFRNRCAHHSRITGRKFPFPPTPTTSQSVAGFFSHQTNDLRTLLVVVAILLKSVNPKSSWLNRLYQIFDSSSEVNIPLATGFSASWRADPLWSL